MQIHYGGDKLQNVNLAFEFRNTKSETPQKIVTRSETH